MVEAEHMGGHSHGKDETADFSEAEVPGGAGNPQGEKTIGQIARAYDVHPVAVGLWKKQCLERGAELFDASGKHDHAERRIAELEQLLGKKEVELALLKNFLRPVA
jgi:transposase-like protein